MRRPSPALVIAFLALLGAWGGPAVAQSLLGSKDIKNNSLRSADVRDRSLRGRDIASNTITGRNVEGLTGRDIMRNGLDGSDIDEDTLDRVPNATRAESAARADRAGTAAAIDRTTISRIAFSAAAGSGTATLFEGGGIRIQASCEAGGNLAATVAAAGVTGGIVRVQTVRTGGDALDADNDFGGSESLSLLAAGADDLEGRLTHWSPSGDVVTVQYLAQDTLAGARCVLAGTAVHTTP